MKKLGHLIYFQRIQYLMYSQTLLIVNRITKILIFFFKIKGSAHFHRSVVRLNSNIKIVQAKEIFPKNKFILIQFQKLEKPKNTVIIIRMPMESENQLATVDYKSVNTVKE